MFPIPEHLVFFQERYRQFRNRIGDDGVTGVQEPVHQQSGYVSELDLPSITT